MPMRNPRGGVVEVAIRCALIHQTDDLPSIIVDVTIRQAVWIGVALIAAVHPGVLWTIFES